VPLVQLRSTLASMYGHDVLSLWERRLTIEVHSVWQAMRVMRGDIGGCLRPRQNNASLGVASVVLGLHAHPVE